MIEFRSLGAIDLRGPDGHELRAILKGPKRLALLAYLALQKPRGLHRRDSLLGLFWPELDQSRARHALRNTLHFLRRSLGEHVLVNRGDEEVGLAQGGVSSDAVAFESALAGGELVQALDLYQGDLLPGFFLSDAPEFERWLDTNRARLRESASKAAWALAEREEEAGKGVGAVRWARRAVALFPDDEGGVRSLIELLDRGGDRAGALREYEAFAQRVAEEYEIEPSPETHALIEEIRSREEPRAGGRVEAGAVQEDDAIQRKKPAIAVLPLHNISPDPGDAYFADGMHEEIISQLSMISSIIVISRNSVMRYRDGSKPTPTPTIASELQVDFVLEGSVRKDSERVRLTAQLIDARTDEHRWTQEYDRDLSTASLFDIQSDVARRVAEALQVRIGTLVRGRLERHPTESAAAYDLYLRATQLPYATDPAANVAAEELLKQAIALDPGFADAQVRLSRVYFSKAYHLGDSRAWADSGLVLARRVVEHDPGLRSGYSALALNYLELGRLSEAGEVYRKVLKSQPNDAGAAFVLGWLEFLRGRLAEAVDLWGNARAIDPLNATILIDMSAVEILFGNFRRSDRWLGAANALDAGNPYLAGEMGLHLRAQGKTSEALDEAERFLSAHPRFFLALEWAAEAATATENYARARQHFEQLHRVAAEHWNYWGLTYRTSYGHVLMKLGEAERGEELLEQALHEALHLVEEGDERPGIRREIAAIQAARGNREQACEWLAKAIDSGWRLERLLPSPLFESLREEKRFQELIRQIDTDIERMKIRIEREGLGPALP